MALPAGCWESDRHASFPTRDVPVEAVAEDFEERHWATLVRPLMSCCYGVPESSLFLEDCFVARYDAGGAAASLAPHRDSSLLSFNVQLSPRDAFTCEGTGFVDAADVAERPPLDAGDAIVHPGQLLHRGAATTAGTRVIVVGCATGQRKDAKVSPVQDCS